MNIIITTDIKLAALVTSLSVIHGNYMTILVTLWNIIRLHVAVKIGTGGDSPHTGEELQGTRGPNSSGGTRNSTRLTSKYVIRGKKKKAKIIRQLK